MIMREMFMECKEIKAIQKYSTSHNLILTMQKYIT